MMKFDPSSIYNRAVSKLQQNPDWKAITNESVISALLKSNAEINAETARYAEYLFKESKWDTAQNESSILAMANMLGYQPKRKISATGKLYVSADPKTHYVGKTISFDTFKNLTDASNTINWSKNPYGSLNIIPASTIRDSKGNSYVVVGSGTLEGNAYNTSIDIVQGTLKSIYVDIDSIRNTFTTSKIYPYLYIPFKISSCEDASSIISRRYLRLFVAYSNDNSSISYKEYRIVDNLLLSTSDDFDVEVYNDIYNRDIFYAKFNNDPSKGSIIDISSNSNVAGLRIEYLESNGSSGNIETLYENFTITNTKNSSGSISGVKLYGINSTFINGGRDEEDTASIKNNATKFYINNYSVGTKESYEKTILNTSFKIDGVGELKPKKVKVFGGVYLDKDTGVKQPVTYVSFISNNLEDVSSSSISTSKYEEIEDALNYYLGRLKSPQDTLKFQAPNYVPIAIGTKCLVSNDASNDSLQTVESNVRSFIDNLWGSNSNEIDFGNNFISSSLSRSIMNEFNEVSSVSIEVEASKKINWGSAYRIKVGSDSSHLIHTCRVPFDFSPIFIGNETTKGFKDYTVGAKYLMRIDLLYKKPTSISTTDINKTIFISEISNESDSYRTSRSFYTVHDQDDIWARDLKSGDDTSGYDSLIGIDKISDENCYQVGFVNKVYTDDDFSSFKNKVDSGEISTQNSTINAGCLDNYMVYFSGNYDENFTEIGNGWIEFSFDALYNLMQTFALYDTNLSNQLADCNLNILKCQTTQPDAFEVFKNIMNEYVDIYICMRPIDNNLKLNRSNLSKEVKVQNGKSVIYADSYDSSASTQSLTENLTEIKKTRMISVNCSYEDQ